jgi:purine-binding chemotaxis protein CheW
VIIDLASLLSREETALLTLPGAAGHAA